VSNIKIMKKVNYLLVLLTAVVFISSCKKEHDEEPIILAPEEISANITSNTTLTSDRVWILKGETHVASGATLTIEPGTVIKSDVTLKGALVVDKGAKLVAIGTASSPIIFTSGKDAGARNPGDWAGITIIGRAPTNRTSTAVVEGGVTGTFGLDNIADDNSGTLKYVRIEYAGIAVSAGSEVNALSLYAVGSGTTLDHIQVSYAKDDSFEFFGGTVNAKYLIAYGTSDDDFDFDFGYSGKLQFGVALRRPELVDAADAGNGVESDNEPSIPGTGPSTPITKPMLSNFTLIGTNGAAGELAQHNFALRLRRASRFIFNNSVILGFKMGGFVMESSQTATAYTDGSAVFKNNLVQAVVSPYLTNDAGAQGVILAAAIKTKAESEGSVSLAAVADAQLTDPLNLSAPDFKPKAGSPALSGTWVSPDGSAFFTAVTYRGAFSTNDNWATGWTNFNPNAVQY
jgi:hypothetical protein